MSNLKIKDVIEIPKVKPNLVVKVGEINNEQKRLAHVRDYVITDSIAKDLESLVKSIAESAQEKDHPVIQELADYRKILEKYPVFIVPVNALDVPDSLKRNFFTSVNNQLKLFGYDTVELSSATQLIQTFEKNAEDEDAFWNLLFKRSLTVTCRQEYDEMKEEISEYPT